jgi:serine/threonine protein kinase
VVDEHPAALVCRIVVNRRYGHVQQDGTFYYVMEYLPGLTLDKLVERDGPLRVAHMIHILRQVSGALTEAHGIGLIHRDIKPGNIIVCDRGGLSDVAKLLDFGIVQTMDIESRAARLTQARTIAGTPAFMSPEQAAGQGVDGRSDIYSLAAGGYFADWSAAVSSRYCHAHAGRPHFRASRASGPSPIRSAIRREAVVLRCLEKNPALRFPDATSLQLALARCKHGYESSEEQPLRSPAHFGTT